MEQIVIGISRRRVCLAMLVGLLAFPALAVNNGDVPINTPESARRMIEDLIATHGDDYEDGEEFLKRLDQTKNDQAALDELIREASLANPLLDFDKVLVIRRTKEANRKLNARTSASIKTDGWDNEISELSNLRGDIKVRTVYRRPNKSVMKHMQLHFDGRRIMFSGVGANRKWAILEVDTEGKNLRELTPSDQEDVDWFDGCYLPEENVIIGCSTAGMQGLPCTNGNDPMVNLYKINVDTKQVRQLTFEQDSDWHPRVLPNGRILYLRWEYTDTPHFYSRYLFHMNPDGTGQMEYWGSGSYFPTTYAWPRPVPNHPSMLIGTVSAYHGKSETGRLMLINPALSRKYPFKINPESKTWGKEGSEINIHPVVLPASETGCVQEIPGWGRDVVGNVYDAQGEGQTYTFGTPWPLSDKYFLVSLKGLTKEGGAGGWNLCLVDIFDNMTTIYADKEYGIFEPIPLIAREAPPLLADRTQEGAPATVFCTDIYGGRGLKGVPRGKVKSLRVFAYHYGYLKTGGHESVGLESSWDIKRILGTVPVESDGSFSFVAPANTPLAIQPLDEDGAALALMRSWMVGMPGETVSCNGCHENQNEVTPSKMTLAGSRAPDKITPWRGPVRPFSYVTEIQPMLDKYCIGCHSNDKKRGGISLEKGGVANLTSENDTATVTASKKRKKKKDKSAGATHGPDDWRNDRSYLNLAAFARRPGPESELDMYNAMEWHASTSPLIQMLRKGHHGVELDAKAWDRFYTWIDLNVPHRGMWNSPQLEKRRLDLASLYAGVNDNPEEEFRIRLALARKANPVNPVMPPRQPKPKPDGLTAPEVPDAPGGRPLTLNLAGNVVMKLVRIPVGSFVMGSQAGYPDEAPRTVVNIDKPFWMGATEVTNKQYAQFDPTHDTRYIDESGKDHSVPGYIANHADQPVARVSWQQAMAFCQWLSEKTNATVTLPTEAQWEWAARAGTTTQFFYGDGDTDFSTFANLADADRRRTYVRFGGSSKILVRRDYPADYLHPLRDDRFTDKWFIVDYVRQYEANPWGLHDMVGNVNEWTRSDYKPYPYDDNDGRNGGDVTVKKVARGGSWYDRPKTAGSSIRFPYESYQTVFNVGFRVIIEGLNVSDNAQPSLTVAQAAERN